MNSHGVLLEKIVGDVMIGIAFEIGFVCLIGLEIDLLILQYFQWLFESSWNLLAGYIKCVGDYIEFFQFLGQKLFSFEDELHRYYNISKTANSHL